MVTLTTTDQSGYTLESTSGPKAGRWSDAATILTPAEMAEYEARVAAHKQVKHACPKCGNTLFDQGLSTLYCGACEGHFSRHSLMGGAWK